MLVADHLEKTPVFLSNQESNTTVQQVSILEQSNDEGQVAEIEELTAEPELNKDIKGVVELEEISQKQPEINRDILEVVEQEQDYSKLSTVLGRDDQTNQIAIIEEEEIQRYATLGSLGGIDAAEIQFLNDFGVITRTPALQNLQNSEVSLEKDTPKEQVVKIQVDDKRLQDTPVMNFTPDEL